MKHSLPPPAVSEVAPLREASRQVVRELGFLRPEPLDAGITHSQCHVLLELERHGLLTAGELSDKLCLDKSTLSRTVTQLLERGLIRGQKSVEDRRLKPLMLTEKGRRQVATIHVRADAQVERALAQLAPSERALVLRGMQTYAGALARARRALGFTLRLIEPGDDAAVARLIRTVMPEFGACGPGYAINDAEVDAMSATYDGGRAVYFVLIREDTVVGGGGIAPLSGGDPDVCELRKMYFLPQARGLGLGQRMLDTCLAAARARGYRRCYLETLERMDRARALYEKNGFRRRSLPLGATGHFSCDAWYVKELRNREASAGEDFLETR